MEPQPRDIEIYQDKNGELPFENWLNQLRDARARLKIKSRLARVALGNLGDCKFIDEGVFELRIDYGAGYRIYFGQIGAKVILLLCGGDKSSQERDIKTAKTYWLPSLDQSLLVVPKKIIASLRSPLNRAKLFVMHCEC